MGDPTLIMVPWWIFDVAIVAMLVGGGASIVESIARINNARSIKWIAILVVAVVCWTAVFYGSFIEPKRLQVVERDIVLNESRDNALTVAVLSDIHVGPYKNENWVEHVVSRVNELDVDIAWIPGDFVFGKTNEAKMLYPLKGLETETYVVMGNHDHEFADVDVIDDTLNDLGMNVLRNEFVVFGSEYEGDALALVGLDDIWFSANPPKAFDGLVDDMPTAVLVHNPDFILDPYAERADLVISAHTHGGQIRLPIIGPVPPLPTKLGRQYDRGEFDFGDGGKLFITQGVGETGPRARLFARPTIDLMTIHY